MTYRRGTVWWIDAHHGGEQYATLEDLVREHVPMHRAETGWIVQDDDAGVHVALTWFPKDEGDGYLSRSQGSSDFHDVTFIPRAMVERVEYLEPIEEGV
jgi:hypothetical protein